MPVTFGPPHAYDQTPQYWERQDLDYPCKHGHVSCAAWERGLCSDELWHQAGCPDADDGDEELDEHDIADAMADLENDMRREEE